MHLTRRTAAPSTGQLTWVMKTNPLYLANKTSPMDKSPFGLLSLLLQRVLESLEEFNLSVDFKYCCETDPKAAFVKI